MKLQTALVVILLFALTFLRSIAFSQSANTADPWKAKELIEPAQLGNDLGSKHKSDALIIHTGPQQLFDEAHIPGAVAVGQTAEPAGEKKLRETLAKVTKTKPIVLYCGCCPSMHCPNIRPAYTVAKSMGFKKIRVLDIPTNFKTDWIKKGYPVGN